MTVYQQKIPRCPQALGCLGLGSRKSIDSQIPCPIWGRPLS